jgi:hypothetical protein
LRCTKLADKGYWKKTDNALNHSALVNTLQPGVLDKIKAKISHPPPNDFKPGFRPHIRIQKSIIEKVILNLN